jgi:hypothetical protein
MTSGAALTFDVDAIYLMPADGWMYFGDTANLWVANHSLVADNVYAPPRSYMADAYASGVTYPHMASLIPTQRLQMSGYWPALSPRRWHILNSLFDESGGIAIASSYFLLVLYQPRFLWGR